MNRFWAKHMYQKVKQAIKKRLSVAEAVSHTLSKGSVLCYAQTCFIYRSSALKLTKELIWWQTVAMLVQSLWYIHQISSCKLESKRTVNIATRRQSNANSDPPGASKAYKSESQADSYSTVRFWSISFNLNTYATLQLVLFTVLLLSSL